jgi:hypothetical protein
MSISLYDVSVRSFLQSLEGVTGFLDKGAAYCAEKGVDLQEVVDTRLFPDMLPFAFQIVSVAHHSMGAIKGAKAGIFGPPSVAGPVDYAALQAMVAEARAGLQALTPDEVNALEGADVVFQIGERKLPFTAENFLMSFSLPNLHFHATTAYDILRMKGAPLGKRDYMGTPRLKL